MGGRAGRQGTRARRGTPAADRHRSRDVRPCRLVAVLGSARDATHQASCPRAGGRWNSLRGKEFGSSGRGWHATFPFCKFFRARHLLADAENASAESTSRRSMRGESPFRTNIVRLDPHPRRTSAERASAPGPLYQRTWPERPRARQLRKRGSESRQDGQVSLERRGKHERHRRTIVDRGAPSPRPLSRACHDGRLPAVDRAPGTRPRRPVGSDSRPGARIALVPPGS